MSSPSPMATHAALHALCLASIAASPQPMEPACALALAANFGSVERWRSAFRACRPVQPGASGWTLLTFQPRAGTLANQWAAEPTQVAAGSIPVLALEDVDAAIDDIDWPRVYERYRLAVENASDQLAVTREELAQSLLLDVRRRGAYEAADAMIPGATWQDPAEVETWAGRLPADTRVVVYCVYGHEVGRSTAMRLRAAGIDAHFLRGGIAGWQAAGEPLARKKD